MSWYLLHRPVKRIVSSAEGQSGGAASSEVGASREREESALLLQPVTSIPTTRMITSRFEGTLAAGAGTCDMSGDRVDLHCCGGREFERMCVSRVEQARAAPRSWRGERRWEGDAFENEAEGLEEARS